MVLPCVLNIGQDQLMLALCMQEYALLDALCSHQGGLQEPGPVDAAGAVATQPQARSHQQVRPAASLAIARPAPLPDCASQAEGGAVAMQAAAPGGCMAPAIEKGRGPRQLNGAQGPWKASTDLTHYTLPKGRGG